MREYVYDLECADCGDMTCAEVGFFMKMKFIVRTVVLMDMESRMSLPENTFWLLIGIVIIMLLMIPILNYGGYYG